MGVEVNIFLKRIAKTFIIKKSRKAIKKTCITITFGDCSENRLGTDKIGNI